MSQEDSFDYIVVGGGTAGCVLASRLCENPDVSVLLLEAGPADDSPDIRMPAAYPRLSVNERLNWSYKSDAEPYLNGRKLQLPNGRVVGGATSVNSMEFVRGTAQDFSEWETLLDDERWSYSHLLPYFRRSETHATLRSPYRGSDGPLKVQQGSCANPLHKAFLTAGEQAGFARSDDLNGHRQEGFAPLDMMVSNGQRSSVAQAYLTPALGRDNLRVELDALVSQVTMHNGRVRGVEYLRDGWPYTAQAGQEVIVCAGAINSAQLLQRSGIGDPADLAQLGVPVVAELAGVGHHLQDQLQVSIQMQCRDSISLSSSLSLVGRAKAHAQWKLNKSGPWSSSHYESGALLRSLDNLQSPDVFCRLLPLAMNPGGELPHDGHSFQIQLSYLRPTSRGHIRLRSMDATQPPRMVLDYLSTENDRAAMRRIVELGRTIASQSAFSRYRGNEITPGKNAETDAEVDQFVREHAFSSGSHSGTCRMGNDDLSVVDTELRVKGVDGLRVADDSVMPAPVSGSSAATAIVIAEKAADMLLGNKPLPPQNLETVLSDKTPARKVA